MGCIICGDGGRTSKSFTVEKGIRNDPNGQIWRCVSCGLIYQRPQPDLADYYVFGEYRRERNSRHAYKRFDRGIWEAGERWDRLLEFEIMDDNILEIGSGAGSFLYVAKTLKSDAFADHIAGVEPDVKSREFLYKHYGINVFPKLGDIPSDRKFDTIVMFHVLEHLADPISFLARLKDRLLPGGNLIVEVPNVDDAMLRLKAYAKNYFYQKSHLWYFSRRTLAKVFEMAGYESDISCIQRYNLKSHLRWLWQRENNIRIAGTPAQVGDGNEEDLRKNWVAKIYAGALRATGRSDTLWAVARGIK